MVLGLLIVPTCLNLELQVAQTPSPTSTYYTSTANPLDNRGHSLHSIIGAP